MEKFIYLTCPQPIQVLKKIILIIPNDVFCNGPFNNISTVLIIKNKVLFFTFLKSKPDSVLTHLALWCYPSLNARVLNVLNI